MVETIIFPISFRAFSRKEKLNGQRNATSSVRKPYFELSSEEWLKMRTFNLWSFSVLSLTRLPDFCCYATLCQSHVFISTDFDDDMAQVTVFDSGNGIFTIKNSPKTDVIGVNATYYAVQSLKLKRFGPVSMEWHWLVMILSSTFPIWPDWIFQNLNLIYRTSSFINQWMDCQSNLTPATWWQWAMRTW